LHVIGDAVAIDPYRKLNLSRNALACGPGVRKILSGSGPHASALRLRIYQLHAIDDAAAIGPYRELTLSRNALACGPGVREILGGSGPHASPLRLKTKAILWSDSNPARIDPLLEITSETGMLAMDFISSTARLGPGWVNPESSGNLSCVEESNLVP
jgi:hypothetical protein